MLYLQPLGGLDISQTDIPQRVQDIIDALDDKRAVNIKTMDLRAVSESLSFFIVSTGESSLQLKAMQDNVKDDLKAKGHQAVGIEGPSERWVLMDYGDIVVHIMSAEAREFYDLEGLWADAKLLEVEPTPVERPDHATDSVTDRATA